MDKIKELTIVFIREDDGTVTTSVKPNDTEFTTNELFMAYKQIEGVLNSVGFDWSIQGNIDVKLFDKEEENGK